jgi:hypothetical protein
LHDNNFGDDYYDGPQTIIIMNKKERAREREREKGGTK